MKIKILILFLFLSNYVFSFDFFHAISNDSLQECILDTYKEKRDYKKTVKFIEADKLYDASDLINSHIDNVNFIVLKSKIFWLRGNLYNAEQEALKVIELCPNSFPLAYYILGDISFKRKKYSKTLYFLRKSVELKISNPFYENAIDLLTKASILSEIINNPVPFNPTPVKGLSSKFDEYLPVMSPDQEIALFTRRSLHTGIDVLTPMYIEEFFISEKQNDIFNNGKPLPKPFNQGDNEGGASLSTDNNTLYFTKCSMLDGYNNCDIYYIKKENDRWEKIESFSKNISQPKSWESQPSISADGNTIIFSSDRSGGFGKTDLYEITKIGSSWSDPINLGPNINSSEHEKSPYLHTDGQTLFFASTNFPSIGGFDIFFSRKDTLGNWMKPVNIGYPINTFFDEVSLFVDTDGNRAYFASNQIDSIGGWDIYTFDLHEKAKPKRVLFLKGELISDNQQLLNNAQIEIRNINTNKKHIFNVENGKYTATLTIDDEDGDFLFMANGSEITFNSHLIDINDSNFLSPTQLNINIEKQDNNKSFVLDNINFEFNSYQLNNISIAILTAFADFLIHNEDLIIEINGYTDNIGDTETNQKLSENRAKQVYLFLLDKKIKPYRLKYNGYGKENPIATNNNEKGRAQNRRTEFKIINSSK